MKMAAILAWTVPTLQVDFEMADFHLRITSAKAKKFSNPELQVRAVHLDCTFLKLNKAKVRGSTFNAWARCVFDLDATFVYPKSSAAQVRGALPEMWGLIPMSSKTAAMLK